MKKKDITSLVLVALISAILSYVLLSALYGGSQKHTLKVEVVNKIDSVFPDTKSSDYTSFFNNSALNPTQQITIGENNGNTKPLNSSGQ